MLRAISILYFIGCTVKYERVSVNTFTERITVITVTWIATTSKETRNNGRIEENPEMVWKYVEKLG